MDETEGCTGPDDGTLTPERVLHQTLHRLQDDERDLLARRELVEAQYIEALAAMDRQIVYLRASAKAISRGLKLF